MDKKCVICGKPIQSGHLCKGCLDKVIRKDNENLKILGSNPFSKFIDLIKETFKR